MADDQVAPVEGDELILTSEDQVQEDQQQPEEGDTPTIEALAQEMGWAPKDDFKGDPEKWKPAAEFIRAGHDIQRNLGKELKGLRSTVDTMAKTSATLFEQQLEAERSKLLAEHDAAVEDGDSKTAFEVARKIDRLEDPAKPKPSAEAGEWAEKHSGWFNKDPLATSLAVETCNKLAHLPVAEQLEQAERAVKKQFPELFPAPAKRQAAVHESGRQSGKPSGKQGFAHLPPEAQKVALDMEDRLGIGRETYATNYFQNQAQSGQARRA